MNPLNLRNSASIGSQPSCRPKQAVYPCHRFCSRPSFKCLACSVYCQLGAGAGLKPLSYRRSNPTPTPAVSNLLGDAILTKILCTDPVGPRQLVYLWAGAWWALAPKI